MQHIRSLVLIALTAAALVQPRPVSAAPIGSTDSPVRGFAAISPSAVNAEPTDDQLGADEGPAVVRAQVLLDHAHFSPGVINGQAGGNTEKALRFFQEASSLPVTGQLDRATYDELVERVGQMDGVVKYTLTDTDVAGPYYWIPAAYYAQAQMPCECYASALEMLDERFHTISAVLEKLNPGVDFVKPQAGTELWVPNVEPFDADVMTKTPDIKPIAKIVISKSGDYLHALAADGSIIFHFPTSTGSRDDPSPSGIYHVQTVIWHPAYHYDPALFADSGPTVTLPRGPNSPVGVVWIATSKDHVGIHGTPIPHTVGQAQSHGCVRLTNWDAARLAGAVRDGVEIDFVK